MRARVIAVLPLLVLAAAWELAGRLDDSGLLPPLSLVLVSLVRSVATGVAVSHVAATLWKTAVSFVLGTVAGVAVGLAIGWFRVVASCLEPLVYFTYALPRVALIPLFVLWLGLGNRAVVALASVAVFYLVLINTVSGVRQIDPLLIRAARNLGADHLQMLVKVLLPAAAVPVFAAVRLAVGQALITVVSGEIVIGESGLGYWIWNARYRMDVRDVFVNLIFLGLLGVVITRLAHVFETMTTRWRHGAVEGVWP